MINLKKIGKILFICSFITTVNQASAQLTIKPHLVFPTGYLGALLKKAPGLTVGTIEDFDSKWRNRMHGDIIYFTPRRDTFDIHGSTTIGSSTTIYPGNQQINLYLNFSYSLGIDYMILGNDKFNWYVGGDLTAGMTLRHFDAYVENISSSGEFDGLPYIGMTGRTGIEYVMEYTTIYLDYTRTYYLNTEVSFLSYNDLGIGISF